MAFEDGCDVIVVVNDDVIFNKSINYFIDIIREHPDKDIGLFGPPTNGVPARLLQKANKSGKGTIEITRLKKPKGILNGFLYAFSGKFYGNFRLPNGTFYGADKKWVGVGVGIHNRIKSLGGKVFIIKDCWIFHHKLRGWKNIVVSELNES